jgi:hypothetical protein
VQAIVEVPEWVVCHQVTRCAAGLLVRCPTRGPILSDECLRCRFMTSSSVERTAGPWCELPEPEIQRAVAQVRTAAPAASVPSSAPVPPARTVPPVAAIAIARRPRVAVGPGIRVARPAVRPSRRVPSGQAIGT